MKTLLTRLARRGLRLQPPSDASVGDAMPLLDRMEAAFADRERPQAAGPRILFGPGFAIHGPCLIHDRLLSYALRLRGAEIIPMFCDAMQSVECNVSGGVWQGQSTFAQACANCTGRAGLLWGKNPTPPLGLSRYLLPDDYARADAIVLGLAPDTWPDFVEDEMPFGAWARDILVNNYVVGDYHRIPGHETLGPAHVRNLLLLRTAYDRVLDDVRPDCIVTNDSYYGMWAILQSLSERRGIPFYSHWIGGRKNAWCYAYNDAAMNLDFSAAWPTFSALPMSDAQCERVQGWLDDRLHGGEMIFDTASLAAHQTDESGLAALVPGKPTAFLPANIIWDLAALNKQVVFSDMMEWIRQTILWFADHPEFQLIVKAHPGELNPEIPATEERVDVALGELLDTLPENIAFVSPTASVTAYEVLPLAAVGLVHTSTLGIEMAAQGMPVITTGLSPYRGFGFTMDASSRDEYFAQVESALTGKYAAGADERADLARKYVLFYHFHYYTKIDLMDYKWGEQPRLRVTSLEDLEPGKNAPLDYVVDSIVQGLPIVGPGRWPPES